MTSRVPVAVVLYALFRSVPGLAFCVQAPPPVELASAVRLEAHADVDFAGVGNFVAPPGGLWILGKGEGCCPSITASRNMQPDGVCRENEHELHIEYSARSHRILNAPGDAAPGDQFRYCEVIPANQNNFGEEACGCYQLSIGERPAIAPAPLAFELTELEAVHYDPQSCGEAIDVDRIRITVPPDLDLAMTALQVWVVPAGEDFAGVSPAIASGDFSTLSTEGELTLAMWTRGAFDVRARLVRASDGAITPMQFASMTTTPLPEEPAPPAETAIGCRASGQGSVAALALALSALTVSLRRARRG